MPTKDDDYWDEYQDDGTMNLPNIQRGLTDEQRQALNERLESVIKERQKERNAAQINKYDSNPNKGYNWGEMFGGLLEAVTVVAKKNTATATKKADEKPKYTPFIIGGIVLLAALFILKK